MPPKLWKYWLAAAPSLLNLDFYRAFHLALVHSAGNAHLDRFAETLWVQSVGTVIYAAQTPDRAAAGGYADDHQAILDAIAAGDADVAERLTRAHILAAPVP